MQPCTKAAGLVAGLDGGTVPQGGAMRIDWADEQYACFGFAAENLRKASKPVTLRSANALPRTSSPRAKYVAASGRLQLSGSWRAALSRRSPRIRPSFVPTKSSGGPRGSGWKTYLWVAGGERSSNREGVFTAW